MAICRSNKRSYTILKTADKLYKENNHYKEDHNHTFISYNELLLKTWT